MDNTNNSINTYELSRNWFNYTFENCEKVKPIHTALYFFIIDKSNRLGNKDTFGLPTLDSMECLGISNKSTYLKALDFLVESGFIKMVKKAKNQYQSSIIAILKNDTALYTALGTATLQQSTQQSNSNGTSTVPIDKPKTYKPKTKNQKHVDIISEFFKEEKFIDLILDFIEHRKEIKKNMTERAIKLFSKKLFELSDGNYEKCLELVETAIERGWSTVFPPKEQNKPQDRKHNFQSNLETDPDKVQELIRNTNWATE